MSVINKMLRDLDSRQAAGSTPVPSQEPRTGLASGTVAMKGSSRVGHGRGLRRAAAGILVAVMVLGSAAGAWWYLGNKELAAGKVDQVSVASTPARGIPVSVAATASEPAVQQIVAKPVGPASPAEGPVATAEVSPKTPSLVTAPVAAKSSVIEKTGAPRVDAGLKMDSTLAHAARPDTASRAHALVAQRPVAERLQTGRPLTDQPMDRSTVSVASVTVPATAISQSPQRQSPALEALAQAQSLWNSASHAAAIDLLRETLAAAERANLAGTLLGSHSVLASLARELARMELAEGQVSQALEMLTRLEPALSGFADVWAIRGNAAQRLGRHQESVAAYFMALKLRPNEARWMLGAAVSLAAQGQTASAAELAEKARAGGVLSPEVAAYLRQLGVPLRER